MEFVQFHVRVLVAALSILVELLVKLLDLLVDCLLVFDVDVGLGGVREVAATLGPCGLGLPLADCVRADVAIVHNSGPLLGDRVHIGAIEGVPRINTWL